MNLKSLLKRINIPPRTRYLLLAAAALLAAAGALTALVLWLVNGRAVKQDYDDIARRAHAAELTALAEAALDAEGVPMSGDAARSGEEEARVTLAAIPVDFDYLWDINGDVVAWLTVPGTEIDYPVLRSQRDNSYYLTHTIRRESQGAASIYMENYNNADFLDFNTLLYGHNMINGTMFAGLMAFEKPDFFAQHDSFVIYTSSRKLTYTIFAAYQTDDGHILLNNDMDTPEGRGAYLSSLPTLAATGQWRELSLSTEQNIVTLSTCGRTGHEHRFVVQGLLVSDEMGYYRPAAD